MLEDQGTEVFLSPVSSLELARLAWGGRISIEGRVQTQNATQALLARTADFTHEIGVASYELPCEFHRDPVDCVLVATARFMDLTLLTADEQILKYAHASTLDARA